MSRLLIKYTTRGRAELFKETIKNIHETISGQIEYKIAVSYDWDDESMKTIFDENILDNKNIEFYGGVSDNKIHAINRDMYEISQDYNWDILINMSDDMKFVVKDWDKFIVAWFNNTGLDAFHHYNDGYLQDKLPTMSIMGREYYERFFYIYPPCYKSYSCDAEAMFVAQMLGKWHYFSDVLFKHEHPANNREVNTDETYIRADKHTSHDTEVYFKRMRNLFYVNNPKDIPSVLKNELITKGWWNE